MEGVFTHGNIHVLASDAAIINIIILVNVFIERPLLNVPLIEYTCQQN